MYEKIASYYKYIFPSSKAQKDFFRRLFEEQVVQSVLDVACGTGEQLEEFARMGLKAHGLEMEEAMVEIIKKKPLCLEGRLTIKPGDMLNAEELFPGPYDAVICVGNSLVHLKDLEEISRAITAMAALLRPGGLVIIQIVNYDRILDQKVTHLPTIETKDEAGNPITFRREYDLSGLPDLCHCEERTRRSNLLSHLIIFKTLLTGEGEEVHGSVPLYPLRSAELLNLAAEAGFVKPLLFGGYNFSPFSPDSEGCILTALKQAA